MKTNKDYSENLKQSGLKITKQRVAILDILDKSKQPIAAEEVYENLKSNNISINLSTVYRTLELLTSKNLVLKVSIDGNSKSLFETNNMMHKHYLICTECKKILDIYYCPLENYEKELEQETHFKISGHRLDIYGLCPQCQKKINGGKNNI
ncbi:MAG: transcriptional repressor [Clostridia bacterium]|jgi:Fur family ferric uptake transcriptional regulator|nr:transcriptional repressor [Clostridia bacterium]MCI2000514.1 transcriptional repressor [Clostridia bacterium]MCI2014969.1 transcriptional repressor [Clostridia bacterium]